jgi:hypothetical protein
MSGKSTLKVVVAFGILAIVLIFLGVNYVPRISASSAEKNIALLSALETRPNYFNERFPRSISPQLSLVGSDYFERHSGSLSILGKFSGSDYFERHPDQYYTNSDWIERHR